MNRKGNRKRQSIAACILVKLAQQRQATFDEIYLATPASTGRPAVKSELARMRQHGFVIRIGAGHGSTSYYVLRVAATLDEIAAAFIPAPLPARGHSSAQLEDVATTPQPPERAGQPATEEPAMPAGNVRP